MTEKEFYRNRKVFVTGHTGFKGSWMCKLLLQLGAKVYGYSLEPQEDKLLFGLSKVQKNIETTYGDIRDLEKLIKCIQKFDPDIVIHMAAQPIVLESYKDPVNTYSTNVMGTVNILEAIRQCGNVKSVVNVTTDKVYKNIELQKGYREDDELNGFDPYSNSKSCSELVTSSYVNSFFKELGVAVSTCRAGNVLGGGDFSPNRIIPDCYRAVSMGQDIVVRNPESVRPYQHVLDPLFVYLQIAHLQYENLECAGAYNIGPNIEDNVKTGRLVKMFCDEWGEGANWKEQVIKNAPHEANYLYLDCTKVKNTFNWSPVWGIKQTIKNTVKWYKSYLKNENIPKCMEEQIQLFMEDGGKV